MQIVKQCVITNFLVTVLQAGWYSGDGHSVGELISVRKVERTHAVKPHARFQSDPILTAPESATVSCSMLHVNGKKYYNLSCIISF